MTRKGPAPFRVAFRADASIAIGTGHIMRCLTLADALRQQGGECVFICRAHDGHLFDAIEARGFVVLGVRETALAGAAVNGTGEQAGSAGASGNDLPHAHWLGTTWENDAADTAAALARHWGEAPADWLVVDHYALDARWQAELAGRYDRLLVIDDLADRPHAADILLDQNAGRAVEDYAGLLPGGCTPLIGPTHALLRPQFADARPTALSRRAACTRIEHMLVTLGGIDQHNATGAVLEALANSAFVANQAPTNQDWDSHACQISVIMGEHAPWLADVRAQAKRMPVPTQVLVNVTDMASAMTAADVCVGAAGSTAWERCALGLPTVMMTLADNQTAAAKALADDGCAIALPSPDAPDFATNLNAALLDLAQPQAYRRMAARAAQVCDGTGTARLTGHLAGHLAGRLAARPGRAPWPHW